MKGVAERHAWGGGLELFFLVEHFFEVLSDGAKNGTTLNFIHFSLEEKKTIHEKSIWASRKTIIKIVTLTGISFKSPTKL